jgi:hypothetical protein
MIRRITVADFPDLIDIARESYKTPFDERAVYDWAIMALHNPRVIAIRDDDAFGFAQVAGAPWLPSELHGSQLYIAMRRRGVWQGLKIARTMRNWCINVMGALDYHFGEATGMNMSVFAKRLGDRRLGGGGFVVETNRLTYVCRPAEGAS